MFVHPPDLPKDLVQVAFLRRFGGQEHEAPQQALRRMHGHQALQGSQAGRDHQGTVQMEPQGGD